MTAKTAGIKKQYLYACVAILLWSTTGAVSKLLLGELTSMQVLCVTCAVAYVSWALAMGTGETAKIANLAYIIPFLSMIWTFFLVGEPIELRSVLGLGVIVAGIFVQLKK